jgi:transmembrane sensor
MNGSLFPPPPDTIEPSPDAAESLADYRTAPGEQRELALAEGVTVEMNTRSSIAVRSRGQQAIGIDLIEGDAAVDMLHAAQPFTVSAGAGITEARAARFEVRRRAAKVFVICLEGGARVCHPAGERLLRASQQVVYDRHFMGDVMGLVPEALPTWRDGILSFQQEALDDVIAEINRYRPGRVVVIGEDLKRQPISGRFRVGELDKAIAQIQQLFRLQANCLPGGVVILR